MATGATIAIIASSIVSAGATYMAYEGQRKQASMAEDEANRQAQMAKERVNKVEDVVKIGDVIAVKVKEIDSQGRISLTHKGV